VAPAIALLDSCVLYSAPLRDLLLSLAAPGKLFHARWSPHIHEEWIRAVLIQNRHNPAVTRTRLERTRALMDENVLDSVVTGYEPLIAGIQLPDPNDRHVVAAAIRGRANVILTFNRKHFPATALREFGLQAQHPDAFLVHLLSVDLPEVCRAARLHRARLKLPPVNVADYLATLQRQNLRAFVSVLRQHADQL
jgi:hypothetical protein